MVLIQLNIPLLVSYNVFVVPSSIVGLCRRIHIIPSSIYVYNIVQVAQHRGSGLDELHTLVRKQLVHADVKYRRLGIIGGVNLIISTYQKEDSDNNIIMTSLMGHIS